MGNRAVITTNKLIGNKGLYVHWNGGADTIKGILEYINKYSKINKENDREVLKEFELIYKVVFSNNYSIDDYDNLDLNNFDNGVYIIDYDYIDDDFEKKGLKIVGRIYPPRTEQDEYNLNEIVGYIKKSMEYYNNIEKYGLKEFYNFLSDIYLLNFYFDFKNYKIYIEDKNYNDDNPNKKRCDLELEKIKIEWELFNFIIKKEFELKILKDNEYTKLIEKLKNGN